MGYRLLHWGPIIALSVIAAISSSTVACDIQWWPLNTLGAFLNIFVFAIWNALTLYNFFRAAFIGPGYVPLDWKPEEKEDVQHLQFCSTCCAYKAPRSHHCRKCGRCVMKMDHHCPWINNCVGHFNHANFTAFLFFAPCGCFHALCILIPSLYRAINRTYYIFYGTGEEPLVNLGFTALVFSMVSVGLAFGVIIAVGGLFVIQIRSIIRNETGIESWIREKAEYRDREEGEPDFVYPYDLGRWRNFRMVIHWNTRPELNGIWWPVRDGCNQFTLTIEQLEQKKEKRERSIAYVVSRPFNGSLCPLSYGLRVCCCPPCMDEQRVRLQVGDRVLVSRFRKHWLYGDKMVVNGPLGNAAATAGRHRGWFPRKCATRWSKHDGDVPHGDVMTADAINNGVNHSAEHDESDRSTKKDD